MGHSFVYDALIIEQTNPGIVKIFLYFAEAKTNKPFVLTNVHSFKFLAKHQLKNC